MRRWLALLLLVFIAATIVSNATGDDGDDDRGDAAARVLRVIDDTQQCWWERQRRFAPGLEDLQQIAGSAIISAAQQDGLEVDMHVSDNRHAYAVTVEGDGAELYVERRHNRDGERLDFGYSETLDVGTGCPAYYRDRGLSEVPFRRRAG